MDWPDSAVLRRFRLVAAVAACSLAIGFVLRAALWYLFGRAAGVGASQLPAILAGGVANDMIVAVYLLAPLTLYPALLPDRWYGQAWNRRLLASGSWLTVFALAFFSVVETY